eukprot:21204-Heterococcus_DN1.PRE.7
MPTATATSGYHTAAKHLTSESSTACSCSKLFCTSSSYALRTMLERQKCTVCSTAHMCAQRSSGVLTTLLRNSVHTAGIADYVDSDVHSVVRIAEQALLQNSDCGPALTWCTENASKLRRLESAVARHESA